MDSLITLSFCIKKSQRRREKEKDKKKIIIKKKKKSLKFLLSLGGKGIEKKKIKKNKK